MVISQTELKAEVIESSTRAFETFFKDISDMFSVNLECTQQEVLEGTIDDIKKHFGGPVAVNTVKAQGVLDGVFQLIFDREALSTLAGVLIMLPEEQIQENRKNNSVEYTQELSDTLAEAGNLLVGAWDRVFRENIEGHSDFTRTNNFIGEPWDEPEAKIGLSENTELVVVPYAMTLGSSPACNCGVIFPKALLGETSGADTQPASDEQETTTEEQALAEESPAEKAEEETAAEDDPSAEQQVPVEEEAVTEEQPSAEQQAPVEEHPAPEEPSAEQQPPVEQETVTEEQPSAEQQPPVEENPAPEEPSAEQQPPVEQNPAPEEPSAEQQPPVEQEAVTEEQPSAEQQPPVEQNPAPEEPSAEEQTPAEEKIPAEKGEDETGAAEESKEPAGGEISKTIQRMTQSQSESPTEDVSSAIEEDQMFGTVGISSAVCAKDIMQKDVAWGSADDNVQQALTKMQQADSGYMMIGGDGKPEGIVSKSDITGAISPYLRPIFEKWRRPLDDATLQIKVKWIMSRPVHTIKPETSLVNIMQAMQQLGLRALPVMDQQGNIQGIVTVFDIIKTMLAQNSQTAAAGKTSQAPPLA